MAVGSSDLAVFLVLECVNVDGLVRGLRSNVFVDGIPGDALDEIAVLSYVTDFIA